MAQNRSSAVMQRRNEATDSLDDFPTPPWACRAMLDRSGIAAEAATMSAWEPAANRGALVGPLREAFRRVVATDIADYGAGWPQHDFLMPFTPDSDDFDWIITNPPYRLGAQFIHRALDAARVGVAVITRTAFLEGQDRFETLYASRPPTQVLIHTERVVMHKAKLLDPDIPIWMPEANEGDGAWRKPSTATSYAWLIWRHGADRQPIDWIPPGVRARHTRPGDYEIRDGLVASSDGKAAA
jgi:hypothetical protein